MEADQLDAPHTATTVVLEAGTASLIDRPLLEAKEAGGGYAVVEVADLDAAISLARSFSGAGREGGGPPCRRALTTGERPAPSSSGCSARRRAG